MVSIKSLIPNFVKARIKVYLNFGLKYQCPICESRFRDFYPIGLELPVLRKYKVIGAGKRNAGCWNCNSSDRERLVYLYVKNLEEIKGQKKIKILHIAPERGVMAMLSQIKGLEYIGADKFTEGYNYPEGVVDVDITNIPYEDNSFDLVICNHVLEHIPDDKKAMAELYRVLKPKGKALLQVPFSTELDTTLEDFTVTDPKDRERVFGQFDHVRLYGADYHKRLEEVGFNINKIDFLSENPSFEKYGINPNEFLTVGVK